jgi:chemotaxis protein methyltransferase CheR
VSALEQVAELIRRESGISLKSSQFPALSAAIARAQTGWDAARVIAACDASPEGRRVLARLIDEVAVKETFFFRHARELAAIEWRALHDAAQRAGRPVLRVWTAACATGEEAYTLAILACEAFGATVPPISILGTDISQTALDWAQSAEYGPRAVRELTAARRERWLQPDGSGVRVAPELRRLVEFRRHNLVCDSIPPPGEEQFDLIVCRNVLIYFDRPTVRNTVAGLERALQPHGTVLLGAADRLSGPLAVPAQAAPSYRRRPHQNGRRRPRTVPSRPEASDPQAEGSPQTRHQPTEQTVDTALNENADLLLRDPLNIEACFLMGVAQLASGDPAGAVSSLRRALYLEPDFGLAAFKLGRAYESLNDSAAARAMYRRSLHSLRPGDSRSAALLDQLDVANVAIACRTRLAELEEC